MIENREQFADLFATLVNTGSMLPSQKDSLEALWQAAWDLGSDAAYDLGFCDGVSAEQEENRVAKPKPGAPIDLNSHSYLIGL